MSVNVESSNTEGVRVTNVTSSYHLFMQRKLAAIKRRQEQRALVRLERAYPKLEAAFTEAVKSGKWIKLGAMQEAYK